LSRLALSLAGVENSLVKWISISVVTGIAWLYYSIKVYTSGFGSYRHLLPVNVILAAVGNGIITTGIVIAIFTGTDNVFSTPEFSGGIDGKTWMHAGSHIVLGPTTGALLFWLLGCVVMFVTKKAALTSSRIAGRAAR